MRFSAAIVASLISSSIFLSCAVKERPPGGPEDKTPPTIISVVPEPGSTMIPPDTRFKITFSKHMNTAHTEEAIFLTPVFWQYPRMKWEGKTLTVIPPENLQPDKTYLVTVGADALGFHGNRMGKSFSFAFSTGEKIDSCAVKGVVFTPGTVAGSYDVWVYTIDDSAGLDFTRRVPEFATQIDSLAHFTVSNMKAGRYLVIAVDDKNNDLFWDPALEPIGLPPFLIDLKGAESFENLVLRPDRRDTVIAYISRAKPLDNRKLEIEFSQPVSDTSFLKPEFFQIIARDDSSELAIEGSYSVEIGKLILETRPQTAKLKYRLIPWGLTSDWGIPFDPAGIGFDGGEMADTSGPRLLSTDPGGNIYAWQDSVIDLIFSERVNPSRFPEAVHVIADSVDTMSFIPQWTAPNVARLRFPARIPRQKTVVVTMQPEAVFDIAGNRVPDSVVSFSFRLPPADTVGDVTAIAEANPDFRGILSWYSGSGPSYQARCDRFGKLAFVSVLPGTYKLVYFDDSDRDGRWSPGKIFPFTPAERFSFLPDTIAVRSRWTTEIGRIDLPEIGD